ncbi:MAG TPA: hypothetical protein VGG39_15885 [Polyangiaceae bacterium]|jgi:hypothetical protein
MKLVRFNVEGSTDRVWVLQHDLYSRQGPIVKTRPIHVMTFAHEVVAHIVDPKKGRRQSSLCYTLEAKLAGVNHFGAAMAEAFNRIPDPSSRTSDLASWEPAAAFVATLEAYLNAVYSTLEVTNHLARTFDVNLKDGFRRMALSKIAPSALQFNHWPWLASFYDVRTELGHHGSPLPFPRGASVVLTITQPGKTHRFERGKQVQVPLSEVLGYEDGLRAMLDEWASDRLAKLDPNLTFRQLVFDTEGKREGHDITLSELMATHL